MSVVFVVFGEKPSSVTAVQMYSSIIPVVAQEMDMNKQVHVFFCFNFNACSLMHRNTCTHLSDVCCLNHFVDKKKTRMLICFRWFTGFDWEGIKKRTMAPPIMPEVLLCPHALRTVAWYIGSNVFIFSEPLLSSFLLLSQRRITWMAFDYSL